jgi:TPR repeat protein
MFKRKREEDTKSSKRQKIDIKGLYKKAVNLYNKNEHNESLQHFVTIFEESKKIDHIYDIYDNCLEKVEKIVSMKYLSEDILNWLQVRITYNSSTAMWVLGEIYHYGSLVKKSNSEAVKWYKKGIEQNDPMALYWLAQMYHKGLGIKMNHNKALEFYIRSAEQGSGVAIREIAIIYKECVGSSKEEIRQFFKYIKSEHKNVQLHLGRLYRDGIGVETDFEEAYRWFSKSAEQGHKDALYELGHMYYKGYGMKRDYKKAIELYTKSANKSNIKAIRTLGDMYRGGKGTEKNLTKTLEWYKMGAKIDIKFNKMIGEVCEEMRNYKEAIRWHKKSKNSERLIHLYIKGKGVDHTDPVVQLKIGEHYYHKCGYDDYNKLYKINLYDNFNDDITMSDTDDIKALKWLLKSAKQGNHIAQNYVGCLYRCDTGPTCNPYALKWFLKSALQGNDDAQLNLGKLYNTGTGYNYSTSIMWYTLSAENDNAYAKDYLKNKMIHIKAENYLEIHREVLQLKAINILRKLVDIPEVLLGLIGSYR